MRLLHVDCFIFHSQDERVDTQPVPDGAWRIGPMFQQIFLNCVWVQTEFQCKKKKKLN